MNQKNTENIIPNVNSKEKEERNVPDLRYISECKLKDICFPITYGLASSAIPFDGIHKYIRITDIDENTGEYLADSLVSPAYFSNEYKVVNNDILFARTGASVGKTYIHTDIDNTYFAGFLMRIRLFDHNPYYIYQQFKTKHFKKWLAIMSMRSGQPGINSAELGNYTIKISSRKLEDKIAEIFKALDNRIITQKKIIEDYESLKEAICNNIFKAKLGTKYPLSLILFERNTYSEKNNNYAHVTLSKDGIFPKNDRYNRDFLVRNKNKEYKITKMNDLCYNPANLKFGVICKNNYGDAIFSPIYVTFEINKRHNVDYVTMLLTNNNFIHKIRKYEQGTVYERMSVNPSDFLKGEINLPNIEKQLDIIKKINVINNKISIEKVLLSLYEKQKQYLLNHMFI